ncbi:hypothetical protein QZH41_012563 [Actinostola sp. cb2023]|nr:hypothetical protein QZH41_012563 [Actinostola sp. cb2023]
MWFQTLKTRQTVKKFTSTNSNGQITALEYSDKKVDVHMLKRESSPLSLDEGMLVGFVTLDDGSMYAIGVSMCGKGRAVLEFKVWDVMNTLGFTSREILVQDMERLNMNEGKLKAIVNLPDPSSSSQHTLKLDSLMGHLAISVGPGLVLMWKCKKVGIPITC